MPYKVALARFPGSGSERMETVAWLIRTVRQMDADPLVDEVVSLCYADTPITMTRNRAVRDAKAAHSDYLLMIDSDMRPDIQYPGAKPFWDTAWDFMIRRRDLENQEISGGEPANSPYMRLRYAPATIAAPYCGPPPDECCFVFHWTNSQSDTPNPDFRLEVIPRAMAAIRAGIEEVAALPTGLILYDMRVFEELPTPWFRYEYEDAFESAKASTEDVYQTRNASILGMPQFCAWDCWAGHVKTKTVGKPVLVTRDQVHQSLVEAVLRKVDSTDRLVFLPKQETEPSHDLG